MESSGDQTPEPAINVAILSKALALGFTGVLCASLFFLPYSGQAEASASVKVIGGQFYWSMTPGTVPAGSEISSEVTSADVNHGFGLYNPYGRSPWPRPVSVRHERTRRGILVGDVGGERRDRPPPLRELGTR